MHSPSLSRSTALAVLALGSAALGACGREVTGVSGDTQVALAIVRPGANSLAEDVAPVVRVRVQLASSEPVLVVDRVITLTPGVDSTDVRLTVPLPNGTGRTGLPMSLTLQFINAAGDTLFRGGPVAVVVTPAATGSANAVLVPVSYVGPGAGAASVEILPASGAAIGGTTLAFTAVARDGQGQPIANTPVVFSTPDLDAVAASGAATANVTWLSRRGSARVVATLLTGPADTVVFLVTPPATQLTRPGGNSQTGPVNTALPSALVVRALAADAGPVPGVTVNFAVTTGGGTLSAPSVVTDANGDAAVTWTLGPSAGAQSVTATATGLPATTFTATATSGGSLGLVFTSNADGNSVSVIDVSDGSRVDLACTVVVALCNEPRNPAINPAGTLIAVPFRFTDHVLLIDPAIPNYVASVEDPSFNEPYAVAFNADGTQLWVANKFGGGSDTGTVSVVDVASRTVIAVVTDTTIGSPEGIAIAGGRAYVANRGRNTLTVLDVATRAVIGRVQLSAGASPRHVVGTPDGQFVYASTSGATIEKIQVSTNTVVAVIAIPTGGQSRNLAVRSDGAFVYVGMMNANLGVVNVATNAASSIAFTGFPGIYGVTLLRDGSFGFVSDENNDQVHRFDPATNTALPGGGFPATTGFTPRGIIAH